MDWLITLDFRFDADCVKVFNLFEGKFISSERKFTGKLFMWEPIINDSIH